MEVVETGGNKYEILHTLLSQPQKYHTTLALLKSLSILSVFAFSLPLFSYVPPIAGVVIASLMFTLLTHLIPQSYTGQTSINSVIKLLYLLRPVYWLLLPAIVPMTHLSRLLTRLLGRSILPKEGLISPELLETFATVGNGQEILDPEEREMISRILDLPDKIVREIMIPRTDIVRLEVKSSAEEILNVAIQSRHSRIPIYRDRVDHSHNIIGILHVKELLDCWAKGNAINLEQLVTKRPPFFTPESRKIWDLFQDLQNHRLHLAIIVDEYGGTAGLVTLEDIIEEIVGEIQDEYDTDEQIECFQLSPHIYSVDARMNIDDFNNVFGVELEVDSVDTIGGAVINHFGQVPAKGDSFQKEGLKFSILEGDNRRVYRIRVDQNISDSR